MPKRNEQYMAARRQEIVDAATRCIAKLGVANTSTTEICREAGISMGALYTHFATKDEILLALSQQTAKRLERELRFATRGEMQDRLLKRLRGFYSSKFLEIAPIEVRILVAALESPDTMKIISDNFLVSQRVLKESLAALQAAGEIDKEVDVAKATLIIESFLDGILYRRLCNCADPKAKAEGALLSILDSLFSDSGRAAAKARGRSARSTGA